jgi:SRSO17 transposase
MVSLQNCLAYCQADHRKDREYSYFISNARSAPGWQLSFGSVCAGPSGSVLKNQVELGMDHYEVRKYPGWHHHILTCMLAHFFLWHLNIRLGKKSTIHYSAAA